MYLYMYYTGTYFCVHFKFINHVNRCFAHVTADERKRKSIWPTWNEMEMKKNESRESKTIVVLFGTNECVGTNLMSRTRCNFRCVHLCCGGPIREKALIFYSNFVKRLYGTDAWRSHKIACLSTDRNASSFYNFYISNHATYSCHATEWNTELQQQQNDCELSFRVFFRIDVRVICFIRLSNYCFFIWIRNRIDQLTLQKYDF